MQTIATQCLQPIKDSVVHSIFTTEQLTQPTQRYVATETVRVPILVNVKVICAGEEVILHVPLQQACHEKRPTAESGRCEPKKSAKRDKTWLEKVRRDVELQRKRALW